MDKEDGMEWNGILCSLTQSYPTLCNPMNCSPPGKNFPGKNTGTGCHFLRGIFPTRGSNPSLLHRQVDSLPLHHVGSPSGISLSHKKGWTNAICSNMGGPGDYHTKSERERQTPCDTTYMWNLKYGHEWTYLQSGTDSDAENEDLWLPRGRGVGGMDGKFEISRCKLFYIEWINNKVLLYSTRNYIQYPVMS